jgi:hypothetical protein
MFTLIKWAVYIAAFYAVVFVGYLMLLYYSIN